ncbi:hypothetical protein HanHA300_Chr03g0084571 [Helianthus annuus]|nr:hypothetical protein HanHA300_Chr03g0084571 [Helianthus annuus]KAJ0607377.1 hypothetical protein HanHA89_Chr03g0096081 [Helianthus annuus]KAJ0767432.1 hypothetical protein HanLR1_Chr03g0089341 [Helianthus annuus]
MFGRHHLLTGQEHAGYVKGKRDCSEGMIRECGLGPASRQVIRRIDPW